MRRTPIQIVEPPKSKDNYVGYVYLIRNKITQKPYVGIKFSSTLVESYWGSSEELTSDIKLLGLENFSRKIIDWAETVEELYQKEVFWIHFLDTYHGYGYNKSEGGGGGNTWVGMTEEQKKHVISVSMSDRNTGKFKKNHITTDDTKRKIKETMIRNKTTVGENNPCYGKILYNNGVINKYLNKSEIKDFELAGWKLGGLPRKNSKQGSTPIVMLDLHLNLIGRYESAIQLETLGYNITCVLDCCKGKQKTHKDLKFMFEKDYNKTCKKHSTNLNGIK